MLESRVHEAISMPDNYEVFYRIKTVVYKRHENKLICFYGLDGGKVVKVIKP